MLEEVRMERGEKAKGRERGRWKGSGREKGYEYREQ
jgi:hypothetical protein